MDRSEHVKKVHEWVETNKQRFPTPKSMVIDEIEFEWKHFSGSFLLKLDDTKIEERFSFSLGIDGKYGYCVPIFGSPLGAPASFAAVELSDETDMAITQALNNFFPKIVGFGLHPISREFINSSTPIGKRIIDEAAFQKCKDLIASGQSRIEINLPIKEQVARHGQFEGAALARQKSNTTLDWPLYGDTPAQ